MVATFVTMYRRDMLIRKIEERKEKRKERKRNRKEN